MFGIRELSQKSAHGGANFSNTRKRNYIYACPPKHYDVPKVNNA